MQVPTTDEVRGNLHARLNVPDQVGVGGLHMHWLARLLLTDADCPHVKARRPRQRPLLLLQGVLERTDLLLRRDVLLPMHPTHSIVRSRASQVRQESPCGIDSMV